MHIHGNTLKLCTIKATHLAFVLFLVRRDADERNIPPLNRIGDPDDILASVRVEDGKVGPAFLSPPLSFSRLSGPPTKHLQIIPETYQAMPSYRVCTAHGITQLTEGLASKLQRLLKECARKESRTANP